MEWKSGYCAKSAGHSSRSMWHQEEIKSMLSVYVSSIILFMLDKKKINRRTSSNFKVTHGVAKIKKIQFKG